MEDPAKRIVVGGDGFGGWVLAGSIDQKRARITPIVKQNHHMFQLLLFQVATLLQTIWKLPDRVWHADCK